MFYGEDGDAEEVDGFSFEAFGKMEAKKSADRLTILENRLYGDLEEPDGRGGDEDDAEEGRFYSRGYDAHSDNVKDQDVTQLKSSFLFMRVVGKSVGFTESSTEPSELIEPIEKESIISNEYSSQSSEKPSEILQLGIQGFNFRFSHVSEEKEVVEEEEEVIACDGVLEEFIALSHLPPSTQQFSASSAALPDKHSQCFSSPPVSPVHSMREEILHEAFNAVWPSVVQALTPLVQKIVHTANESGLVYSDEPQDQPSQVSVDCWGSDGSGDGWG